MISSTLTDAILADLDARVSYRVIADRYGVCKCTVYNIARRHGRIRKPKLERGSKPEFRTVTPYICTGEDGDLHPPIEINVEPCVACLAEKCRRSRV